MTNAELIEALRKCGKASADRCWDCTYYDREPWCESALANDAADALEAADKKIAELGAQMPKLPDRQEFLAKGSFIEEPLSRPKEGEWIDVNPMVDTEQCSICGWNIPTDEFESNYCPNCGAKMKGANDGES